MRRSISITFADPVNSTTLGEYPDADALRHVTDRHLPSSGGPLNRHLAGSPSPVMPPVSGLTVEGTNSVIQVK
jgi:hypothetical protein